MKGILKLVILFLLLATPSIYANSRSSHDLAMQVQQKLATVAPNTVIVVIDEGNNTAYLQGNVTSQDEVNRITEVMEGFHGLNVDDSYLVVDSATAASLYAEDENETPEMSYDQDQTYDQEQSVELAPNASDASLNAAVIDALKSEGIMGQSKIRVKTEAGIVTLTGTALSTAQADRIVELTREVPGVVAVNPNLQLRDEKRLYKVKPSPQVDKEGREVEPEDHQ